MDGWEGNNFGGLYLYGPPGNGKTHAAIGLGRALHEAGAEVHYRHVSSITSRYAAIGKWTEQRFFPELKDAGPDSVFPQIFKNGVERNPKSVLILDEYIPAQQKPAIAAVEAAEQYGGLVIMTSNHSDPFRLTEPTETPKTPEELLAEDAAQRLVPEKFEASQRLAEERATEITAGFRSRVAAGILHIQFSGPDRRPATSIWADFK